MFAQVSSRSGAEYGAAALWVVFRTEEQPAASDYYHNSNGPILINPLRCQVERGSVEGTEYSSNDGIVGIALS